MPTRGASLCVRSSSICGDSPSEAVAENAEFAVESTAAGYKSQSPNIRQEEAEADANADADVEAEAGCDCDVNPGPDRSRVDIDMGDFKKLDQLRRCKVASWNCV